MEADEFKDLLDLKNESQLNITANPGESILAEPLSIKQNRLRAIFSDVAARNLAIFLAIYSSLGIAGGIPTPVFGAYWFGDCLSDDGKTIIEDEDFVNQIMCHIIYTKTLQGALMV